MLVLLIWYISLRFHWISAMKKQKPVYWIRHWIPNRMVLCWKTPCASKIESAFGKETPNEAFQRGIWNKLWISKRTKQLRMNLKRHPTMKYLGALNTTYLVFIEYQQQKSKNTLWPLIGGSETRAIRWSSLPIFDKICLYLIHLTKRIPKSIFEEAIRNLGPYKHRMVANLAD